MLRLPYLRNNADYYRDAIEKIVTTREEREEQYIIVSPEELKVIEESETGIKTQKRCQQRWFNILEAMYFLVVAVSAYTDAYVTYRKEEDLCFNLPMFLTPNTVMIYAILRIRFIIQCSPETFPSERMIMLHVFIFTTVTSLWVTDIYYWARFNDSLDRYTVEKNNENKLNYILIGTSK